MLPSEALYPYTAKEARERGELELWRANFRTNCACAGAIELAIRKGFDGMHLSTDWRQKRYRPVWLQTGGLCAGQHFAGAVL